MDPKNINQTNFCNKRVENIISNELKQYILSDIKNRTNITFNSRYAKLFNDKYKNNLNNPHIACLKTSGTPYLLFFTKINNINYCLLIDKKINTGHTYPKIFIVNLKFNSILYNGTLFEIELLRDKNNNWQILISDIYYYDNNIIYKNINIIDRINTIHEILNNKYNYDSEQICPIYIKKYFEVNCISNIFNNFVENCNYNIRGIYLIPININYSNLLYIIKKEDDLNQIKKNNFNFKIVKHSKPEIFELYLKNDNGFEKINYAYIPNIKTSKYVDDLFKNVSDDSDIIVECIFNSKFNKWIPLKKTDKRIDHIKDYNLTNFNIKE
tara:strand:+ start:7403 stop:8380 length:978 start_codon:yes stop_codon:yes gene_type:complete